MPADDKPQGPFNDQDGLNKFVADAKALILNAPTEAEKLSKVKQLTEQLQAGLDELKVKQAEAAAHVPSGTEGEVIRSYSLQAANRDQVEGGVLDLRKSAGGKVSETNRWVGNEAGVVRMLGGIEDGAWEFGLMDDPKPKSMWQAELQEKGSKLALVQALAKAKGDPDGRLVRALRRGFVKHLQRGPAPIAKLFSGNTGEGGEFTQTLPLSMIERTAEIPRIIEGQLEDMPLSAGTVKLPFLVAGAQAFVHGRPIAADLNAAMLPKSVPSTAERTLTAPTLAVNIPVELDAIEDMTVTDGLGLLQQILGEALVDAREDTMFNGDTTSPHGDTALASWNPGSRWSVLGSPADHRTAFMGWRQSSFDRSSDVDQSVTQTIAGYIAAKANFTTPHGVLDVFFATSPEHYLAKVITDSNVLTVDKFGPGAVIHTGVVASIGGSPLFLSQFCTADMNASGVYDGVTTTYTSMLIVSKRRWKMARRRALRVNVEVVFREGVAYLVASERAGMVTIDGSTVKNVVYLRKLAKS